MASLLIAKLIAIAVIVICIVQWVRYARKEGSRKVSIYTRMLLDK